MVFDLRLTFEHEVDAGGFAVFRFNTNSIFMKMFYFWSEQRPINSRQTRPAPVGGIPTNSFRSERLCQGEGVLHHYCSVQFP